MDEINFTLAGGKGWEGVHEVDDPVSPPGSGKMIVFADRPDFVRYPDQPVFGELAGRRGDIVEERRKLVICPVCKAEGNKTVWTTRDGIDVILCAGCKQYIWSKHHADKDL